MLRISDFSILSQLSTKMLRHYADIDLLPQALLMKVLVTGIIMNTS